MPHQLNFERILNNTNKPIAGEQSRGFKDSAMRLQPAVHFLLVFLSYFDFVMVLIIDSYPRTIHSPLLSRAS